MKIALLTIWHEKNYGAELQAYATVKTLQQLGHDVKMIDIRLSDLRKQNINGRIASVITKFTPSDKEFRDFWKKFIPVTERYHTIEELQANPPEADVYLVGSDQVWNPEITHDYEGLFFLNFGGSDVKRISYASSFGVAEWKFPAITDLIMGCIERFAHLTCREKSGVAILNDVFGKHSVSVIDPTLLLCDYKELTGELTQKQTLVYYPLSTDPALESVAIRLADKLHLKAVNNKKCSYLFKSVVWSRVSIEQWIKNIAESQFVLTRSFHGLIFSILYHRQFAVVIDKNGRSTRLENLLEELGVSDRLYGSFEDMEDDEPWNKPINYVEVDSRLLKLREKSLNELTQMLEI